VLGIGTLEDRRRVLVEWTLGGVEADPASIGRRRGLFAAASGARRDLGARRARFGFLRPRSRAVQDDPIECCARARQHVLAPRIDRFHVRARRLELRPGGSLGREVIACHLERPHLEPRFGAVARHVVGEQRQARFDPVEELNGARVLAARELDAPTRVADLRLGFVRSGQDLEPLPCLVPFLHADGLGPRQLRSRVGDCDRRRDGTVGSGRGLVGRAGLVARGGRKQRAENATHTPRTPRRRARPRCA
jgi:hypothetical protein